MSKEVFVGSKDCSIEDVLQLINSSSSFSLLHETWSDIAVDLGIPFDAIMQLRRGRMNTTELPDVLSKIIHSWFARLAPKARLSEIVKAFKNAELHDLADQLQNEFNYFKLAESGWNELPIRFQKTVKQNLLKFYPDFSTIEDGSYHAYLKGPVLIDLIKGKKPELFKEPEMPQELPYYVNRSLFARNLVSQEIFLSKSKNLKDILLLTGMEKGQLNKRVKTPVHSSTDYLAGKVTAVKFMILDKSGDFQKVWEKARKDLGKDVNIHWLEMKRGNLRWVDTKESIELIQKFQENKQDEIVEDEFINELEKSGENSKPVIISGGPGTGKTFLLEEFSRKLKEKYPTSRKIIYLTLAQFMKEFKQKQSITEALEEFTCVSDLGRHLFQSLLKKQNGHIQVDLFLDGFDEVDASESAVAFEMLEKLQEIPTIRLWLTCRDDFLQDIERKLNIFGYNIAPFTQADQEQLLTEYWISKISLRKKRAETKLVEFAGSCFKVFHKVIETVNNNVLGVPLLCLLLAKIYEDEAEKFANEDGPMPEFAIEGQSILERFVSKKLQKYRKSNGDKFDEEKLMIMHSIISLQLLFPQDLTNYISNHFNPIDQDLILDIEIFEESSRMGESINIIHKTIGEYFIAWFLANSMTSPSSCKDEKDADDLANFLAKVLSTGRNSSASGIELNRFSNPVICHFLNDIMKNLGDTTAPIATAILNINKAAPNQLRKITLACANSDFLNIFNFFANGKLPAEVKKNVLDFNFINLAVQKAGTKFVQSAFKHFEGTHGIFTPEAKQAILLRAIKQGKLSTVEHLINNEKGFKELASNGNKLIHHCVQNSRRNMPNTLHEKTQVMQLLYKIHPGLLEQRDKEGKTPLLLNGVHFRLIKELIEMGADVTQTDNKNRTILHMTNGRMYLMQNAYLSVLQTIPLEKVKTLSEIHADPHLDTPLHSLVRRIDPDSTILERFKKAGANFNKIDKEGHTVLALAESIPRSQETLNKLRELGATMNPDASTWFGWNCCRMCCFSSSSKIVEDDESDVDDGIYDSE